MIVAQLLAATLAVCDPFSCPSGTDCDRFLGHPAEHGVDPKLPHAVNLATGNAFYAVTDATVTSPLGVPVPFVRSYNSQGSLEGYGFGRGWSHSFSWRVETATGSRLKLVTPSGRAVYFAANGTGGWTSPPGEFGALSGDITHPTYVTRDGTQIDFYSPDGVTARVVSISTAGQRTLEFTYSSGKLSTVVADGVVVYTFAWSGSLISSVTTRAGTATTYTYNSSSLLVQASGPSSSAQPALVESYSYLGVTEGGVSWSNGGASRLTRVWRDAGSSVSVTKQLFSYSSAGRTTKAGMAGLSSSVLVPMDVSYGSCASDVAATVASFAEGSKTVTFQNVSGHPRVSGISASGGSGGGGETRSAGYGWNSNLTLAEIVDGEGTVSLLSNYDSRGNPQLLTEAYGTPFEREVSFTYHPTISVPIEMVEPGAGSSTLTTVFDYDDDYDTDYNEAPGTVLRQLARIGGTDTALSGTVTTLVTETTAIEYDTLTRVTRVVAPSGVETVYGYHSASASLPNRYRLASITQTGAASVVTQFTEYDLDGRLVESLDPNGVTKSSAWSPAGLLLAQTMADGSDSVTAEFGYDADEVLTSVQYRNGAHSLFERDGAGRIWRRKEFAPGATDPLWTATLVLGPRNEVQVTRRFLGEDDVSGPSCDGRDAEEYCLERQYDGFLRLKAVKSLDSQDKSCASCATEYVYDGNGNLSQVVESGGRETTYFRDALGRIAQIDLPGGASSFITWNAQDRMIQRQDALERLAAFDYDDFGRRISYRTPDVAQGVTNYYPGGLPSAALDPNGSESSFGYDGMGRLTSVTTTDGYDALEYFYDQDYTGAGLGESHPVGRLTRATSYDRNGVEVVVDYAHDYLGRTSVIAQTQGGRTSTLAYAWGPGDELTSITYPSGRTVNYDQTGSAAYAPAPLPTAVSIGFQSATTTVASSISYFTDGAVRSFDWGNGGRRELTRNRRGELMTILSGQTSHPVVDQALAYDEDGLGLLAQVTNFPGTSREHLWTFGYDARGRLTDYTTDVRGSTELYQWTYDLLGNPLSEDRNGSSATFSYDSTSSRLESISGRLSNITYTSSAAIDTYTDQVDDVDFSYDTRDWLSRIERDKEVIELTHDAFSRRVRENKSDGTWVEFLYDNGGRLMYERAWRGKQADGGSDVYETVDYVYLGTGANLVAKAQSERECFADGGCASPTDVDLHLIHEDYRGGVAAVESYLGASTIWQAEYLPTGDVLAIGLEAADGRIGTWDDAALPSGVGPQLQTILGGRFGPLGNLDWTGAGSLMQIAGGGGRLSRAIKGRATDMLGDSAFNRSPDQLGLLTLVSGMSQQPSSLGFSLGKSGLYSQQVGGVGVTSLPPKTSSGVGLGISITFDEVLTKTQTAAADKEAAEKAAKKKEADEKENKSRVQQAYKVVTDAATKGTTATATDSQATEDQKKAGEAQMVDGVTKTADEVNKPTPTEWPTEDAVDPQTEAAWSVLFHPPKFTVDIWGRGGDRFGPTSDYVWTQKGAGVCDPSGRTHETVELSSVPGSVGGNMCGYNPNAPGAP